MEDVRVFKIETVESEFLFNNDVNEYLRKVGDNSLQCWSYSRKLEGEVDDRDVLIEKQTEMVVWFANQDEFLKNIFAKYIKFKAH